MSTWFRDCWREKRKTNDALHKKDRNGRQCEKIIRFTTKPSIHKCIFSIADFFHQNNLDIYLKKWLHFLLFRLKKKLWLKFQRYLLNIISWFFILCQLSTLLFKWFRFHHLKLLSIEIFTKKRLQTRSQQNSGISFLIAKLQILPSLKKLFDYLLNNF